jgi:hypothetical protein
VATILLTLATVAAAAGEQVVCPFNGKNLDGWKTQSGASAWVVGSARLDPKDPHKFLVGPPGDPPEMVDVQRSVDIYTQQQFRDCTVSLELMISKDSNSGVYLMGEYEVQVLDSYGKKHPGKGDMGALYSIQAPKVNACAAPGQWQSMVIQFQAPKFADGKKVQNGRLIKVTLNGQVVQENVEIPHPTPAGLTGHEMPQGPLMLQGDHGPVSFRNIKITVPEDK